MTFPVRLATKTRLALTIWAGTGASVKGRFAAQGAGGFVVAYPGASILGFSWPCAFLDGSETQDHSQTQAKNCFSIQPRSHALFPPFVIFRADWQSVAGDISARVSDSINHGAAKTLDEEWIISVSRSEHEFRSQKVPPDCGADLHCQPSLRHLCSGDPHQNCLSRVPQMP